MLRLAVGQGEQSRFLLSANGPVGRRVICVVWYNIHMASKHPNYDLKFKGGCIALLIGANYPSDKYALTRVANHTSVSRRTLYRWWHEYNGNPDIVDVVPPDDTELAQVVTEKKLELIDMLDYITYGLASEVKRRIDNKDIDDVSIPQLMTGLGIGIDKQRLLTDKSTENNAVSLRIRYENDWRAPGPAADDNE